MAVFQSDCSGCGRGSLGSGWVGGGLGGGGGGCGLGAGGRKGFAMKMDEYELQEMMGWNVKEGNMDGVVKKDATVNGKMTDKT